MAEAVLDKWLSEAEAQEYSSLSRTTLRTARNDSKLTYRQFGGKVLYRVSDIDNYIKKNSIVYLSVDDGMTNRKG